MKFFLAPLAIICYSTYSLPHTFPFETQTDWGPVQECNFYGIRSEIVWKNDSCYLYFRTAIQRDVDGTYVQWLNAFSMDPETKRVTFMYKDEESASKIGTENFIVSDKILNYWIHLFVYRPKKMKYEYHVTSRTDPNVRLSLTNLRQARGYFEVMGELFCYYQEGEVLKIRSLDIQNQKRSFDFSMNEFSDKKFRLLSIYPILDSDRNRINTVVSGVFKEEGKDVLCLAHAIFNLETNQIDAETYRIRRSTYMSDLYGRYKTEESDSIVLCNIKYADFSEGKLDNVSFEIELYLPPADPSMIANSSPALFSYKNEDGRLRKIFASKGMGLTTTYYVGKFKDGMLFITDGMDTYNKNKEFIDYSEVSENKLGFFPMVVSYIDSNEKIHRKPLQLSGVPEAFGGDLFPFPNQSRDEFRAYICQHRQRRGKIVSICVGELTIK